MTAPAVVPRLVPEAELAELRFAVLTPFRQPVGRIGSPVRFKDPEAAERWIAEEQRVSNLDGWRIAAVLPDGTVVR